MQKWEYLEVENLGDQVSINGEIIAEATRGTFGMGKKRPNFSSIINDLGEQGWELVATNRTWYYFKRPKKQSV